MRYLVKHPPLRERERAIKEMLVKQPNDVCVEPVETTDSLDQILITFHVYIILKLLDKVKQFEYDIKLQLTFCQRTDTKSDFAFLFQR